MTSTKLWRKSLGETGLRVYLFERTPGGTLYREVYVGGKRAASKKRADGKKQVQELMSTAVRTVAGAAMGWTFASYPEASSLSIPGSSGQGIDTTLLVGVGAKLAALGGVVTGDAADRVSEIGDAALVLFAAGMAQDFVAKKE